MGVENYKILNNFVSDDEVNELLIWVNTLTQEKINPNHHLTQISKSLNGNSYIFDISNTDLTNYITNYQSIGDVKLDPLPSLIIDILKRISNKLNLPRTNCFLQVVDMEKGGKISPHYDASIDGYINYKCNISVLSEDYNFYIDKTTIHITQKDLYCFEASLFKHHTDEFKSRRVFLSFGFIIPYNMMGRDEQDHRVRLSKRIKKYLQ